MVFVMPSIDRNLSLLFIANALVAVYINMTGTFIPLFIRDLGASVFQVSLVIFVGGIVASSVMVPSGLFSDKYGRRAMIILSMVFLIVAPLLYAVAGTWQETFLFNVIGAVAFSLFAPARMTMIADSVKLSSLGMATG